MWPNSELVESAESLSIHKSGVPHRNLEFTNWVKAWLIVINYYDDDDDDDDDNNNNNNNNNNNGCNNNNNK